MKIKICSKSIKLHNKDSEKTFFRKAELKNVYIKLTMDGARQNHCFIRLSLSTPSITAICLVSCYFNIVVLSLFDFHGWIFPTV